MRQARSSQVRLTLALVANWRGAGIWMYACNLDPSKEFSRVRVEP